MLQLLQDPYSEFSTELKQRHKEIGWASVEREREPKWYMFYSEDNIHEAMDEMDWDLNTIIEKWGLVRAECYYEVEGE